MLGSPLVIFAAGFVALYVTFLVTRSFTPGMLGEVAARPAAIAALIALVALPMDVALLWAFSGRALKAALTGAKLPTQPVRTGWRRFGGFLVGELPGVAAALIVFEVMVDPSAAPLAPLLAITVLGPIVLYWSLTGVSALCRWGWRHR